MSQEVRGRGDAPPENLKINTVKVCVSCILDKFWQLFSIKSHLSNEFYGTISPFIKCKLVNNNQIERSLLSFLVQCQWNTDPCFLQIVRLRALSSLTPTSDSRAFTSDTSSILLERSWYKCPQLGPNQMEHHSGHRHRKIFSSEEGQGAEGTPTRGFRSMLPQENFEC